MTNTCLLLHARPYLSPEQNKFEVFNEVTTLVFIQMIMVLDTEKGYAYFNNREEQFLAAYAPIGVLFFYVAFHTTYQAIDLFKKTKLHYLRWKVRRQATTMTYYE